MTAAGSPQHSLSYSTQSQRNIFSFWGGKYNFESNVNDVIAQQPTRRKKTVNIVNLCYKEKFY